MVLVCDSNLGLPKMTMSCLIPILDFLYSVSLAQHVHPVVPACPVLQGLNSIINAAPILTD